jgi:hypothetical protein
MLLHHARLKQRLRDPGREFTIEEAREAANQLYEHGRIDIRDPFHKTFFEEIFPLFLIAEYVANKMTKVAFKGKDHPYDGEIIFGDQQPQKVELTAAIDGHQEDLRMELLEERKRAPAFQKIQYNGTRKRRAFSDNELEAICPKQYAWTTLRCLLEKALRAKIERAPRNQHYNGAWLGIVFDDWLLTGEKEHFNPVCESVLNCAGHCPFVRMFFVGFSGKYLFDSDQLSDRFGPGDVAIPV